jgi:molybdopterin molybdotransferase
MDGFAYASADGGLARAGDSFRLVGSIAAGSAAAARLERGDCARIMTGAPVPEGAAAVHRLELASASADRVAILEPESAPNIVRRAANRPAGQPLFGRRLLRAQDLGILAANGIAEIEVVRRPIVRVLSTGDELVAADGSPLGPGRIYDSNGPQLVAQAEAAGCEASFAGIVPDDEGSLRAAIAQAAATADLVILSGGVSAGDFDFVPAASEREGFRALFRGIAMKPGKPAFLARRDSRFLYGVPGNPLAAFVNFEVLIRPLIARLCGLRYEPGTARVRLGAAISRREADRVEYLPVELRGGIASPLRCSGSGMLDALAGADALVRLEAGRARAEAGEEFDARLV